MSIQYGKVIFEEGEYKGEVARDYQTDSVKASGFGVLRVYEGNSYTYIGKWKNNHMTFGFKKYDSGEMYLGDFYKGEFHGKGCHIDDYGNYYIGDFVNGERDGFGVCFFHTDVLYMGNWKEGYMCGEGYYSGKGNGFVKAEFYADHVTKILWEPKGRKYTNDVIYFGDLAYSGDYLGFGEHTAPNGTRQIGNWLSKYVEGAKAISPDAGKGGRILEVGKFHISGRAYDTYLKKIYANGDMVMGDYYMGNQHGRVAHVYNYGQCLYIGEKENGKKQHGGTLITSDGLIESGTWDKDYFLHGDTGSPSKNAPLKVYYGLLNGKRKPQPVTTTASPTTYSSSTSSYSSASTSSYTSSSSSSSSTSYTSASSSSTPTLAEKAANSKEAIFRHDDGYHFADWAKKKLEDFNYKNWYSDVIVTGLYTPKKHVEIPDFVTNLAAGAFKTQKCAVVESITVPKSVRTMGGSCFIGCTNLKKVDLQAEIDSIPVKAFAGTPISYIVLPDTVKAIRAEAFAGCKNLKTIYAPKGCKVADDAIPDGCQVVDKALFKGEESVGASAPVSASKPTQSSTPKAAPAPVKTAQNTDKAAPAPTKTVKIGRKEIPVPDGYEYKKVENLHLFIGTGKDEGTIILPEGVVKFAVKFSTAKDSRLQRVKKLVLPSTFQYSHDSFADLSYLEEVDFSKVKIDLVPFSMFARSSLKKIVLPAHIVSVQGWAFEDCKQLESAYMPGVKGVAASSFGGCTSLKKLTVKYGCSFNATALRDTYGVKIEYV